MIPLYYFTGFAAFFLAFIAAFFSISGLGALYAAAFIPIVIMGTGIEFGKIMATFWLHRNFRTASKVWIILLATTVIGAMVVTSGGVYGFLAKGHIEQEVPYTDKILRIERIDNQIKFEQNAITRAQIRIDQLDGVINTLIEYDKISGPDGARAVRERQQIERDEMQKLINESYSRIAELNDKRLVLQQEVVSVEAKLGPVKYLAALFETNTDDSVIYFTLLIVILLDPFAIMLVIATSISYDRYRESKQLKTVNGETIREVIKEVPVEVEKIVTKEIPAELSLEAVTEFLKDAEVQKELIRSPELLSQMEKLVDGIGRKKRPAVGWIDHKNPVKKGTPNAGN